MGSTGGDRLVVARSSIPASDSLDPTWLLLIRQRYHRWRGPASSGWRTELAPSGSSLTTGHGQDWSGR